MDAIETNPRYAYVKRLAESSQERARKLHKEYQELDDQAKECQDWFEKRVLARQAASKLNDFFYWIGHANAYRGIALQVDFMETVEDEMDADRDDVRRVKPVKIICLWCLHHRTALPYRF